MQCGTQQTECVSYMECSTRFPPQSESLPPSPYTVGFTTMDAPFDCSLLSHSIPSPSLSLCHMITDDPGPDISDPGHDFPINYCPTQDVQHEFTTQISPPSAPVPHHYPEPINLIDYQSHSSYTWDFRKIGHSEASVVGNRCEHQTRFSPQDSLPITPCTSRRKVGPVDFDVQDHARPDSVPSLAFSDSSELSSTESNDSRTQSEHNDSATLLTADMSRTGRYRDPLRYYVNENNQYISAPMPNVLLSDSAFQKSVMTKDEPAFYPSRPAPYVPQLPAYPSETSFFDWETSSNEGMSRLARVKQNFADRKDASRTRSSSNTLQYTHMSIKSGGSDFSRINHTVRYGDKPMFSTYSHGKQSSRVTPEMVQATSPTISSRVTSPTVPSRVTSPKPISRVTSPGFSSRVTSPRPNKKHTTTTTTRKIVIHDRGPKSSSTSRQPAPNNSSGNGTPASKSRSSSAHPRSNHSSSGRSKRNNHRKSNGSGFTSWLKTLLC